MRNSPVVAHRPTSIRLGLRAAKPKTYAVDTRPRHSPKLPPVDLSGSRHDVRSEQTNATRDRFHCPPGKNHPIARRMNAISGCIHCPQDEIHPTPDRIHCPQDEIHPTPDGIHCPPGENHPLPRRMNAIGGRIHAIPGRMHDPRSAVKTTSRSDVRVAVYFLPPALLNFAGNCATIPLVSVSATISM
jgi:hypothetical protein